MAEKRYNVEEALNLVLEYSDDEFLDSKDVFVADVEGEDLQPLNFPQTLDNIPVYERDSMLFMDDNVTYVINFVVGNGLANVDCYCNFDNNFAKRHGMERISRNRTI